MAMKPEVEYRTAEQVRLKREGVDRVITWAICGLVGLVSSLALTVGFATLFYQHEPKSTPHARAISTPLAPKEHHGTPTVDGLFCTNGQLGPYSTDTSGSFYHGTSADSACYLNFGTSFNRTPACQAWVQSDTGDVHHDVRIRATTYSLGFEQDAHGGEHIEYRCADLR